MAYDEAAKNTTEPEERSQWQAAFNSTAVKLKAKEAEIKEFCEQTGLQRETSREQVFATATENGIKGFGKSVSAKAVQGAKKELDKYNGYHYNDDGTIVVTDDWIYKPESVKSKYKPFAIVDTEISKGPYYQRNRTYYDKDGIMYKQVHGGHHGNAKKHPYGNAGEHMHIYTFDSDGNCVRRITDELTETERKECADIISWTQKN